MMPETSDKSTSRLPGVAWVLFFALLFDLIAFTMILPLLPALLDYYGENDSNDVFYQYLVSLVAYLRGFVNAPNTYRWNSILFGGIIGSFFSVLQFTTSPLQGALSDIYGRKLVLLSSTIGVCISYFIWSKATTFSAFLLSRAIGGLCKGNVSISVAIVADVCSTKNRPRGMALIGIAFSLGFVVGPVLGVIFLHSVNKSTTMLFEPAANASMFLCVVSAIIILFFIRETLPYEKRIHTLRGVFSNSFNLINPFSLLRFTAVSSLSQIDQIRRLGLGYFLYLLLFSGVEFTLTFLVHQRFSYTSGDQGKMFLYLGAIMMLVQGAYVRRLQTGQELKVAKRGILLLIPSFVIMGLTNNHLLFYFGLALFAFGSATVVSCLLAQISYLAPQNQRGILLGIFRSLGALARALGPVAIATIFWSTNALFCYSFAAVGLTIPYLLLKLLTQRNQGNNQEKAL